MLGHCLCDPVEEDRGKGDNAVVDETIGKRHRFDEGGHGEGLEAVVDDASGADQGERHGAGGGEDDDGTVKDLSEDSAPGPGHDHQVNLWPLLDQLLQLFRSEHIQSQVSHHLLVEVVEPEPKIRIEQARPALSHQDLGPIGIEGVEVGGQQDLGQVAVGEVGGGEQGGGDLVATVQELLDERLHLDYVALSPNVVEEHDVMGKS